MMSQSVTPQSNAKRYWGEEKNIDSIYSIYIKKICYTYNNDVLLYGGSKADKGSSSVNRRHSQDEKSHQISAPYQKHAAPTSNVAKIPAQEQQFNDSQKKEGAPRSRKNFFLKYRRRSCSVDKYSFEKAHKDTVESAMTATPTGKVSKAMRYGLSSSSTKKKFDNSKPAIDVVTDKLDRSSIARSSMEEETTINLSVPDSEVVNRSESGSSKGSSIKLGVSTHKSMNDISVQSQAQSLLWETRQIKILQAATLDHVLKFILLISTQNNEHHHSHLNNRNSPAPSPLNESMNESGTNLTNSPANNDESALEEERNNVAHIIHVFFCTYRIYTNPYELMLKLMDYSDLCRIEQYRFVMYYWMDNYPEDFDYIVENPENSGDNPSSHNHDHHNRDPSNNSFGSASIAQSMSSYSNSVTSYESSATGNQTNATTDSENQLVANAALGRSANAKVTASIQSRFNSSSSNDGDTDQGLNWKLSNLSLRTIDSSCNMKDTAQIEKNGVPLINELLRLCQDEHIRKRAAKLNEFCRGPMSTTSGSIESGGSETVGRHRSASSRHNHYHNASSKNSAILDLDSRYVAQQLTAIDLDNFLNLRPYLLLEGSKSDERIRSMIRNFNLLSRHVVVTILRSHNPNIVTAHWIAIAMNLRKIKNFNSLKAIIAGLTNESIYRLKQLVWNKLDRISLANFKLLASIVDDVNNQVVLRQTQLIVEGTAKMSIEDDSFGTIPYLGTFLTDLNMIDARHPSYIISPKDEMSKLKLINFEKCAKQFEILTQVQLLQKNVLASLHAIQRRNNFDEQTTLNRLKLDQFSQSQQMLSAKPVIPKVSRLFETWFFDDNIAAMTDKQCYRISVTLEPNVMIGQ